MFGDGELACLLAQVRLLTTDKVTLQWVHSRLPGKEHALMEFITKPNYKRVHIHVLVYPKKEKNPMRFKGQKKIPLHQGFRLSKDHGCKIAVSCVNLCREALLDQESYWPAVLV